MCISPIKIKRARIFLTEEEKTFKDYFKVKKEKWLKNKNKNNKKEYSDNEEYEYIEVPCGHCIECLQQRSTDIFVRGIIEYKNNQKEYYGKGCFITLTYKNKCLPENRSLKKQDYIVFLRELRRHIKKVENRTGIRILGCGEYGTLRGRPHYHLTIFNWCPDDLVVDYSNKSKTNNILYKSATLSKIWGKGRVVVGMASEKTVGYIAGYTTKKGFKINKKQDIKKYENREKRVKDIEYIYDNETQQLKRKTKSLNQSYIEKVRLRNKEQYVREYEFIATPKSNKGGLGSMTINEMIEMTKKESITINDGHRVKTYSIPYYYIKKLIEYKKMIENRIDWILQKNTNILKTNKNYFYTDEAKKETIILSKICGQLRQINQILLDREFTIQDNYERIKELAKKHGMTAKEYKEYQAKIRLRKTMNRLENLKRDFEVLAPGEIVNNHKAWFLENQIGELLTRGKTI